MKKSDIAIYVSAVLTLVLTTFVVFSTQKVAYENKIDDILKKESSTTNDLALSKSSTNEKSDAGSPLFVTKKSDLKDDAALGDGNGSPATSNFRMTDMRQGDGDGARKKKERSFADINDFELPKTKAQKKKASGDELVLKRTEDSRDRSSMKRDENVVERKTAVSRKKTTRVENKGAASGDGAEHRVTNGGERGYTVQSGDVLWRIAERHGIPTMQLIKINKLSNPNMLYPGMKLVLR